MWSKVGVRNYNLCSVTYDRTVLIILSLSCLLDHECSRGLKEVCICRCVMELVCCIHWLHHKGFLEQDQAAALHKCHEKV
jgi:hypothetical protein